MATVEATVKVAVEEPAPVIEAGLKPTVTPAGAPVAESATEPVKPFSAVVVIVEVPELPCTTLTAVGAALMVKSGGAVTVRLMVVLCEVVPLVPVRVIG